MASLYYGYGTGTASATDTGYSWNIEYADCTSSNSHGYKEYIPIIKSITSKYTNTLEEKICYKWDNKWDKWDDIQGIKYNSSTPTPPADLLREMIRQRQGPTIVVPNRRQPIKPTAQQNELRARATLRRVIGDQQYRRFLKNGFITAQGRSGKIYQIRPGHDMTTVWLHGKAVEKLCVVLSGSFPPTDSMIMRYLMVLNDEDDFRSRANVFNVSRNVVTQTQFDRTTPLPELYRKLKAA